MEQKESGAYNGKNSENSGIENGKDNSKKRKEWHWPDSVWADRNHPSVVLWETALNESRYPVSLAKEIFELSHAEYPGDQMYTAGDYFGHAEMEPYYDVFYKQVSKFPKDGDVMSNYPEDFIVVKPLFTREWGDGVGEKPRVSLKESEEDQMRQ